MMRIHQITIIITILVVLLSMNVTAQVTNQSYLPEDAILRIGKGILGEIAYFPDGTRFAVATSIGIWIYDSITGDQLYRLTDSTKHTYGINTLTFSHDGRIIATESPDATVLIWGASTAKLLRSLDDDEKEHLRPIFSSDGNIIATSSGTRSEISNKSIVLWDVRTGQHLFSLAVPSSAFYNKVFSPDGKIIAIWEHRYKKIQLWNVNTGQHLRDIITQEGRIDNLFFSPDGNTIVTFGADTAWRLWDINTGEFIKTLFYRDIDAFSNVCISVERNIFASTGTADGQVHLWDATTGEHLRGINVDQNENVGTIGFSPNGKLIAASGSDGTIYILSTITGEELVKLIGHKGYIETVTFSPDGLTLLSMGSDKTVRLWDTINGKLQKTLDGYLHSVNVVTFSQNGDTIASWWSDETLRLWDKKTGQLRKQYPLNHSKWGRNNLRISPNGNTFTAVNSNGFTCLWDVATGQSLNTLSKERYDIDQIEYSPNGKTIVSRSSDYTVRLWNADTGQLIKILNESTNGIYGINYSTDGTKLVTRSRGNTVKFWDTSTCKLIYTLTGIIGGIKAVYISRLSNTIVTSIYDESWDDGVYLWDGRTGQPLQDTTRVSPGISFVRPSPNGKIIAMVDGHSSWVNIYDISLRQSMHTLIGHVSFPYCGGGTITAVCFSPDGRNVVTASGVDGRAIIWNPSTGERLKTLSGHTSGINSVAFSPDGKTLATSSSDGTILLWDLQ